MGIRLHHPKLTYQLLFKTTTFEWATKQEASGSLTLPKDPKENQMYSMSVVIFVLFFASQSYKNIIFSKNIYNHLLYSKVFYTFSTGVVYYKIWRNILPVLLIQDWIYVLFHTNAWSWCWFHKVNYNIHLHHIWNKLNDICELYIIGMISAVAYSVKGISLWGRSLHFLFMCNIWTSSHAKLVTLRVCPLKLKGFFIHFKCCRMC